MAERLPLTEGAERLIATLKRLGYKIAILSGGFTYFGEPGQAAWASTTSTPTSSKSWTGKLTGRVIGRDRRRRTQGRAAALIAGREGEHHLEQVIAVGDGANDLPMLSHRRPRHRLPRQAHRQAAGAARRLSTVGLDGILYLIGMRDREMENAAV